MPIAPLFIPFSKKWKVKKKDSILNNSNNRIYFLIDNYILFKTPEETDSIENFIETIKQDTTHILRNHSDENLIIKKVSLTRSLNSKKWFKGTKNPIPYYYFDQEKLKRTSKRVDSIKVLN